MVEKENGRIILICGGGRRINLPKLIEMEDFFDKKEKEEVRATLVIDKVMEQISNNKNRDLHK